MVVKHAAGREYPRSYAELRAWFDADWKCLDYLDWLRWPKGFVCPHCASVVGWRLADSRWKCGGCDRKVSATAGTIFDKTRTPLTVWFATAWRMVGDKVGVSATQVQREMELGSYQTAWVMLHRYRSVMVRPGRDRPCGDVEVDESFLGGPEPGVPGRGALGKVLFAGAVELDESGFGRAARRHPQRQRGQSRRIPGRQRRARQPRHHRRLVGLPCGHPGPLRAHWHLGGRLRPGRARSAAGGSPGLLPGEALAVGHPPRLGRRGPPAELPRCSFEVIGSLRHVQGEPGSAVAEVIS